MTSPRPPMWRRYLRFAGPDVGADVDEELRFHLDMREESLVAGGMPEEQARDEARRRLGDLREIREQCCHIGDRAERTQRRRESLLMIGTDLRRAARALWRAPGFTLVAVLTLALGIGASTAIFSVVHGVLFRPLPVEGLDRLVVLRTDLPGLAMVDTDLGPPEIGDLAALEGTFESLVGVSGSSRTLTGFGEPVRISAALTLGDLPAVFGVAPQLGRFYRSDASTEGPWEQVVLSHELWQQLSDGDPSFVGRTLELNGAPHEVVGVMPPGFRFPRRADVWMPFGLTERMRSEQARGVLIMTAVGRLRAGVTPEALDERLRTVQSRWQEQFYEGTEFGKVITATPFLDYLAGPLRPILIMLMGAVLLVLLIAAANVASLQLVRAAGRTRELAVRAAIGAGRRQLLGPALMESLLLAALGGALGVGIGALSLRLLAAWEPAREMNLAGTRLDGTVLAFTAAVALASAVGFGVLPALRASRVQPQSALRGSGRGLSAGPARSRLLRGSVVVQVMLALALLLGSGLMIRTLTRMLSMDPGFDPGELVTAQVSVAGTPERVLAFHQGLLERVRAQPGVQSAALVSGLPLAGGNDSSPFEILGRPPRPGEPERHAEANVVSPGYFATLRIPLLRGRDFDGTERVGGPVAVVIDQTFAEQFFPGEDPVGRQIRGYTGDPATIIGVAGRVDQDEIGDAPKALAYYAFAQQPWRSGLFVAIRTPLAAESVATGLRAAVAELDASTPVHDLRTMEARIRGSLGPRRLAMLALGAFAGLSLLLAALGVYGVMRYTTGQRSREIGIRMAMGARPGEVVRLVVRQGMGVTGLGMLLGVPAALLLARLMESLLFGVSAYDPVSLLGAASLLAAAALVATWLPARRASRVDPNIVLRSE